MMTFCWQTLCILPSPSRRWVSLSVRSFLALPRDTMTNCKLKVEWTLSRCPFPLMRSSWCLSPGCHLLFAIWGAAQHSVAFEIDEAFVVLANEAQITRQFWCRNMRCFSSLPQLFSFGFFIAFFFSFFGCLSTRSALATLFFFSFLLNHTNSLRSYSFKALCTHWKLIKHIKIVQKWKPLWPPESQYTTK